MTIFESGVADLGSLHATETRKLGGDPPSVRCALLDP